MNYYNAITGAMPTGVFMAALTFAACGFAIHKYFAAKKRDTKSSRTPANWSWKFWIKDNIHEGVAHMIMLFCGVRFAPDLIKLFVPEQLDFFTHADSMLIYLPIGWLMAMPLAWFKKKLVK